MGNQSRLDQGKMPWKRLAHSDISNFNSVQALANYAEIIIHVEEEFHAKHSPWLSSEHHMVAVRYSMAYKFPKNFVSHLLLLICFRILLLIPTCSCSVCFLVPAEISTCCPRSCGLFASNPMFWWHNTSKFPRSSGLFSSNPVLWWYNTRKWLCFYFHQRFQSK